MNSIKIIFVLLAIVYSACTEDTIVNDESDLYSFEGYVYSLVDSQKIPQQDAWIYLGIDSVLSDKNGKFTFEKIQAGNYEMIVKYVNNQSETKFINYDVIIPQELEYEEFILNEKYTFSGSVYTQISHKKMFLENAEVQMGKYKMFTDENGKFLFNLQRGHYDFHIKYTDDYFEYEEHISLQQTKQNLEYFLSPKTWPTIKVFSTENGQIKYLNGLSVTIDNKILNSQNLDGEYSGEPFPPGSYSIAIGGKNFYSSIEDSIQINQIDSIYEYELKHLLDEDIIYVEENDYYYYSSKDGVIVQITHQNCQINDEFVLLKEKKYFAYTSTSGLENYINVVDLSTLNHNIIFTSPKAISQLKVSPDETKIYFRLDSAKFSPVTIANIDINSGVFTENITIEKYFNYGPKLFNDCKRLIYGFMESEIEFISIINYSSQDTSIIDTVYDPFIIEEVSNDDSYVSMTSGFGENWSWLLNINTHEKFKFNSGYDIVHFGKFLDNGKKVFSLFNPYYSGPTGDAIITDILSMKEYIISHEFKILYISPDYSAKTNLYLFSVKKNDIHYQRDILLHNASENKNYKLFNNDMISRWGAKFISKN